MSPTDFFKLLGAPLKNQRWSWGAVRESDNALFLRVWQDETRKFDGKLHVMITAHAWFKDDPGNLGHVERLRHVKSIHDGTPTFAIMCVAKDKKASPRVIDKYDRNELFIGGGLRADGGEEWLELTGRRPVSEVRPNTSLERTREK